MNATISLTDRIQSLLDDRQQHADAISAIDNTLEQINALLGAAPAVAKPAANLAAVSSPAAMPRKHPPRAGELPTTGQQSILALIREKRNPTTREINARFKAEGRRSAADSLPGSMVRAGILKKKSLGGKMGSEYSLAAASPATASPTAPAKKNVAGRRGYSITAEELIVGFVKQKGQPTTQELKKMWINAGRASRFENELSRMVTAGKLKRTPLKDKPGSRYSIA